MKTIINFRGYWDSNYSFVEQVLTDKEIQSYLDEFKTVEQAVEMAYDYVVSQGLADVQE